VLAEISATQPGKKNLGKFGLEFTAAGSALNFGGAVMLKLLAIAYAL
jgi:hypothetical protein